MKKIFIQGSLLTALVVSSVSCSKKIDEAYLNPNADFRAPVESLLPQIISAMAANYAGHGPMHDARYVGAYIQNWHFFGTNSNFDRMGHTNADIAQSVWRMHYYDIGQNNQKMIEWGIEEKKWDYVGVGKAIEAWSWLTTTDYHGEVILKEAFRVNQTTFKFDPQQDVYEHVRKLCFEALDYLNRTGDGVSQQNLAKGDAFFYNGDVNKWKKFVYAVLARYHNHLSNKTGLYKPDSVIYYGQRAITSVADNALVKFAGGPIGAPNNFFGPLRGNLAANNNVNPTAIRQGAYIANLMSGRNPAFNNVSDPRAVYLLRLNTNNTFVGVPLNGGQTALGATDRPENFWGVRQDGSVAATLINVAPSSDAQSRFIFTNTAPFPVITSAEVHFMIAEAAHRSGNKGLALTAYREGISQHFDMLTSTYNANIPAGREITPAVKAAFLANTAVVPATAAELTLQKIMMQKYIAMFGYGVLETWGDMRRYHYTDADPEVTGQQVYAGFIPPTGTALFPDNLGKLVYRMRPRFNAEYVWNIEELRRIGATDIDYHTRETWFSQR